MKTKILIMGLIGLIMLQPMSVQAADCANGYGTEIKGNDHGTYCQSRVAMNWWSAHAWCDAIGMKLVSMEECKCNDESKCDMTKQCPNLYKPSQGIWFWTATPNSNNNAYFIDLVNANGNVSIFPRNYSDGRALCMP